MDVEAFKMSPLLLLVVFLIPAIPAEVKDWQNDDVVDPQCPRGRFE